jgi:Protein of unknown function (DUF2800).
MQLRAQFLRPSGAAAWVRCALYVAMCAAHSAESDEQDNEVREDGTACHWLASELFEGRFHAVGSLSPNNRYITQEMFDACDLYFDVMKEWPDVEHYAEISMDCGIVYPGITGTPDMWAYRPGHLRVMDLKYGFGFVEVFHNLQLTIYAIAIAQKLRLPADTKVELIIVQPRAWSAEGDVRRWFTTVGFLCEVLVELQAAARRAMEPNPVGNVGSWCIDCPGRLDCETFLRTTGNLIDFGHSTHRVNPTPEQAASELKYVESALALLEARKEALHTVVEHHHRNGGTTRHYRMAPTSGRESWKPGQELAVIEMARQFFNVNIAKPITPKQARLKIPSRIVDAFADKPKTAMKLVPIGPHDVAKAFSPKE